MTTAAALAARTATLDDISELCAMMADFNRIEGIDWTRERGEPALRTLIAKVDLGVVGILHTDPAIAGYFVLTWGYDLEWPGRDAYLTEFYLAPAARGRGLGAAALAHAEAFARENAARALYLMVRPENAAALRVYQQAGYRRPPRTLLSKQL